MPIFKEIVSSDISTTRTQLNQLIDVIQEDISGSSSRRSYQVYVTGGIGPGVTSSLFQTVYDQDFSLQTANPIFDLTVGLFSGSNTVGNASTGIDTSGKLLFPSETLMMREKVDIYRQYAQTLLGNAESAFFAPGIDSSILTTDQNSGRINEAMFVNFRRLFARDSIKRETFAMRFYQSASLSGHSSDHSTLGDFTPTSAISGTNINRTSERGQAIFTDIGSATDQNIRVGGNVGTIVNAANTEEKVGLMWYDFGVAVFDLSKICWANQHMSGTIDNMVAGTRTGADGAAFVAGTTLLGDAAINGIFGGNENATFIPDFICSASIDNIVDHLAASRFSSGTLTAGAFQNNTNINSTLYFCRAAPDEFNYSSNPTYTDSSGNIVVIDQGQEGSQRSFTFVSTVGLYNANNELLAVAKLSRPVEKNDEKDLSVRVRLDF